MHTENKNLQDLYEKYPFIIPRDIAGKYFLSNEPTCLYKLPQGWISIILQLLEELRVALIDENLLYNYYLIDSKERYGHLVWQGNINNNEKINSIIAKYDIILHDTCLNCGQPAAYRQIGWYSPFCASCANQEFQAYQNALNAQDRLSFDDEFIVIN